MEPDTFPPHAIPNYDIVSKIRTMHQLHALHANGAVLNKRQWWVQWTTMPEVRDKWLAEIEEEMLQAHVTDVWSVWPNRPQLQTGFEGLTRLLEIADMADETEKQTAMDDVLSDVIYPPGYDEYNAFDEGTHYEKEEIKWEDEWEELEIIQSADMLDEALDVDPDFEEVFAQHKQRYGVAQIAWYVAMTMVREELRLLSPVDWTRGRIDRLTQKIWAERNQEVVLRSCALISAIVKEEEWCTLGVLNAQLPNEHRPDVLKLLQYHFTKICIITMDSIEYDVETIADNLDLAGEERLTTEPVHVPGPVPKTWMSDNCIPEELKSKFVVEIARLEEVQEEPKDWDPNSNNQVLNLVDPSLLLLLWVRYIVSRQ